MKKLLFTLLSVVLVSASANSQSQDVRSIQERDLKDFGYPIIYEEPLIQDNTNIYITYKNITSEVIRRLVFTYYSQDRGSTMPVSNSIQPGESRQSGWAANRDLRNGKITRIEVTFADGKVSTFDTSQVSVMLVNKDYSQGYVAQAERQREQEEAAQRQREQEETPRGNPSIYIEKRWADVVNGNFSFGDAYSVSSGMVPPGNGQYLLRPFSTTDRYDYWFNFKSDVYIKIPSSGGYFILVDDEGNEKNANSSIIDLGMGATIGLYRLYNVGENSNFNPEKKYRVYYRLRSGGPEYLKSSNIYVDAIEGLLTYAEAQALDQQARQRANEIAEQNRLRDMNMAYSEAIRSNGVERIIEYIKKYRRENGFNNASYAEIAKRITGNTNILFKEVITAPNPYAFDTTTVYYCNSLYVENFIRGQIVAYISSFIIDDGNMIVIRNVPDISKIGRFISNAYLKYTGVSTVALTNGRTREMATFDMFYHFDN